MKIYRLPREVYEKIAAGEVIDKPVAVVRELVDNSIDANASFIKVIVVDGGKTLIQVSDDGEGMSREDLLISFEKHTTSKIKNFEDIYKTYTMGFRGEALFSIASVSEMEISSRTKADVIGNKIILNEGKLVSESVLSRNVGTTVKVKNLFYNVPARRKFLKSDASELLSIKEHLVKTAIAHYNINFSLENNGKNVFITNTCVSPIERIEFFLGKEIAENMLMIEGEGLEKQLEISGYISKPSYTKSTKKYQYFYINKRAVISSTLSSSFIYGYKDIIPKGDYPPCFIFIDINPELIDLNIHPAKKEIKFKDEKIVFNLLKKSIEKTLRKNFAIPTIESKFFNENLPNEYFPIKEKQICSYESDELENKKEKGISEEIQEGKLILENRPTIQDMRNNFEGGRVTDSSFLEKYESFDSSKKWGKSAANFNNYKILGLLFDTYVLIEAGEDFIVLDQHAAHERLLYEQIKDNINKNKLEIQNLLTPFTLDLSPYKLFYDNDNKMLVEEMLKTFKEVGFLLSHFGDNTFLVEGIPNFIEIVEAKELLEKLLERYILEDCKPNKMELIESAIKYKACRNAVKSGDYQGKLELTNLIANLFSYENPFTCPHGRPTAVKFSKYDIEKFFKRR